jgi:hypothetical protein
MFFGGLIMNKFLITIATLVAFALGSVAVQAQEVSGFMQRIVGAGDDVDGGIAEQFTRFNIAAEKTADNGWVVGGSMSIQTAATTGGTYGPSTNHMYIATDMATINVGNTMDALTSLVPAVSAMVPGGGVDAGYQFLFDAGNLGHNTVSARESYYANNSAKIDIDFPSVNGFTVGISYTPSMEFTGPTQARQQAETTANHGETVHVAASYSGDMDGLSYVIGAGVISGNAQSQSAGSASAVTNNDLSAVSAAIKITMGNMTIGLAGYDNGASWGASTDTQKANSSGWNSSIVWVMGNISVGAGYNHQELTRGTRAQAAATTLTSADAGNVREDNHTFVGVGYDMGGGVNTYVQLSNNDHSDGDHATTEVDPQVLFAGINIGF